MGKFHAYYLKLNYICKSTVFTAKQRRKPVGNNVSNRTPREPCQLNQNFHNKTSLPSTHNVKFGRWNFFYQRIVQELDDVEKCGITNSEIGPRDVSFKS